MAKLHAARICAVSGVTLLGACLGLLALYVWFTGGEIEENRYANYVEARESLHHGWLPTTLPPSATEIHEWHDIDANLCFGSFRFDPRERPTIEFALWPAPPETIRIDRDPSFASLLPRDPSEEQLARAGFEFYSDRDFAFAISWKAGIAFFWNSTS